MQIASDVLRPSDVSTIQVFIVDHCKRDGKTRYIMNALHVGTRAKWAVEHSYSEFLSLRDNLHTCVKFARHRCPGCVSYTRMLDRFPFPPKKLLHLSNGAIVQRSIQLSRFMTNVMSHTFTTTPKCQVCGGTAFDLTKMFLLDGATSMNDAFSMNSIAEALVPRAFFVEYCRSSSKIECYKGRTIVKVVQVQRHPLAALRSPVLSPSSPISSNEPQVCEDEDDDFASLARTLDAELRHTNSVSVV
ncbi:hypothetical protein H310_06465 [Aphanomyces invadans]|uniref:PX domain-containing protein n=1 Tax=Aphanomyces invadans TaxID=157072 RepID=A0A024U6V5_9STRA|nr:hypothetical protein H310_06465 [Aphanomyces invadans]ETW01915.1 hypothetical protein H310_06465 [Aphanomyces invadans]|eukprot:XP_008869763.1 hypothetical protein H310_06465 [Aphanomyces invadans]